MADAYKGLTIRIGGETTGLQKALQAVNSAASQTQKQLSRLKQAAKMDPGNMGILDEQIEAVGQRAVEASARLKQLKSALSDVAGQKVTLLGGKESTKTIGELASETKNAALRAAEAKKSYNEVTSELAKMYAPIDKAARATDEFGQKWKDLHNGKEFKTSDLIDEQGIDAAMSKLRELNLITEDEEQSIRELRASWEQAFDENEIAKSVAGMKDLENEITRAAAQAKSFATEFTNLTRVKFSNQFGEGIDDQLTRINTAAQRTEETMRRMKSAFDVDPSNVGAATEYMRSLSDSTELAQQRADLLRQKLARMDAAGIGDLADDTRDVALEAENAAAKYEEVTTELLRMQGILETLNSRKNTMDLLGETDAEEYQKLNSEITQVTAKVDQLTAAQNEAERAFNSAVSVDEYRKTQAAVAEAEAQVEKYNNQLKETTNAKINTGAFTTLGLTLSTTVTPALVQVGRAAIDSANTFDSAYRDMRKTVDGTEEQFEELRQAAIDFSMTHVTSADQILSIQAIGGELGVATEDLKTFAETVSNLDVATNLNADEAATSLGQLDNIMNDLSGETYQNFSDALVRLGNNGASTEDQIADIATRIGAMGSILGFTTPEVLAWASSIASTGQNAEAAGTAVANTMSDIETAVAKGGDSLQAFAEVAGMSAEEFASSWKTDPSSTMKAFIEGLNNIEQNGGSATKTLDDLGITAARQVQAIEGLMQTVGGLDDNLQMSNDAWNGVSDQWGKAGDAAREADSKAEGFSGSLSRLQNVAQNTAATIGSAVEPAFKVLADVLSEAGEWFNDLPTGIQQVIVALGGITAALGPMTLLVNGVGEFVDKIKAANGPVKTITEAMGHLGANGTAAQRGISALSGALGGLGPLIAGLGITAVVGLIADMSQKAEEAAQHEETMKNATEGLADACQVASTSMADMSEDTQWIGDRVRESGDDIDEYAQGLSDLADSFDSLNEQTAGGLIGLQNAKQAIQDFGDRGDLTANQVGQLKAAVQLVNDSLGTNYQVVRNGDGVYQVLKDGVAGVKDEIYELIDAQMQQMQIDAQMQKLESLYEQQAKGLSVYNDALQVANDAQAKYNDLYNQYRDQGYDPKTAEDAAKIASGIEDANSQLSEARDLLNSTDEQIQGVTDSIGNMTDAAQGAYEGFDQLVMEKFNDFFDGNTDVMLDFSDALEASGHSIEEFANLNSSQLSTLTSTWSETGGDINQIMTDMGIHFNQTAQSFQDSISSMADGQMADMLSGIGINLYDLSEAMANAGISTEQMSNISQEQFALMATNCGGDVNRLIAMIANYNGQPIYNKDGTINVNDVRLLDAQNNVYVWNGTELKTLSGQVVVQKESLEDAQGDVYTWNDEGQLVNKNGEIVVDSTQIQLANGEIATYNNGQLVTQTGEVIVGFQTLTDCNGAMVEYNGTKLNTIKGQVDVDYKDVTNAISQLKNLSGYNGTTVTTYVNTVRTTTNRTVNETVNTTSAVGGGGSGVVKSASRMSAPMSLAASRAVNAAPIGDTTHAVVSSAVPSQQYAAMARSIASNPTVLSQAASNIASSVLSTSKAATTRNSGVAAQNDGSYTGDKRSIRRASKAVGTYVEKVEINQKVITPNEDIYVSAPIAARSAAREIGRLGR